MPVWYEKKRKKVSGKKIDQVATISANNDKDLGKIIGEAFKLVDETGVVLMETHENPETTVELIEGVQYNQALKNNHFITNKEKGTAEALPRYNRQRAVTISAAIDENYSLAEAMKFFENTLNEVAPQNQITWKGKSEEINFLLTID